MGRGGVDVRARSIRVTYTYQGAQCRRTLYLNGTPLEPTPANVRYAERLAAEIRDKIRLGLFVEVEYFPASGDTDQPTTVARQLTDWLAAQRIEPSTRAGYEAAARFWSAALPDKSLRALKHSDILRAIAARPDLSGKTVNNYTSVLREALQLAVADRLLADNPAAAVPRAAHQKQPPDPFDEFEREQIIESISQRHPGQVANLVQFWFWTGLRTGEAFGLNWQHVSLAKGEVLIQETLVRGLRKANTKTNVARIVKLNSRALAALQAQRQHTQMAGGQVFTDPRYGEPWNEERAFRRSFWTPTLKLLGLRYRRPYQMRHTYATAMLMAGMAPAFCARQMGHSVEQFLRTYAKWIDGQRDDLEMRRLELLLGDKPGINAGHGGV